MDADWLVVIDAQRAFAELQSPWCIPGFAGTARGIAALVERFGSRTVFTRFVPPADPEGSWHGYYRRWEFALDADNAGLWQLVAPWTDRPSVDSHQFSKWGPGLRHATAGASALVLCGVATECCVLATALAAVDGGAQLRVVADACGSKQPDLHRGALALLEGRAPQLTITHIEDELGSQRRTAWHASSASTTW